jgi:hypothetical protein
LAIDTGFPSNDSETAQAGQAAKTAALNAVMTRIGTVVSTCLQSGTC